jgi:DNA-binding transcriptional LysR family regulator
MQRGELNDLLAFATVARERSFTRAAQLLGISPSALSHAMRALETRLDVRLLARTTRSVAPTEAGMALLASVAPALAQIEDGLGALSTWRASASGTVRLTTFAHAAQMVLEPRLPAFLMANPGVRVEVEIENRMSDIVADGFDAGIRHVESVAKDMIAVRIGPDLRTIVVATPEYFSRHPPPLTPADLERHACINYRGAADRPLLPWEFEREGREIKMRVSGPLIVNDTPLALAAVRAGAGLGYILENDVVDDLASGRLVQALDEWSAPFPGYHLYHSSRRQTPPALRALIEALRWRGAGGD